MSLSNDEVVQSLMATMDSINKQLANERKERKQEKKASDEKIAELLQEIEKEKTKKTSSDTQELLKKYGELEEENQSLIERNRILEKDVIDKTNEYLNMKEQKNRAQEKQKELEEKNDKLEKEILIEKGKGEDIVKQFNILKKQLNFENELKSKDQIKVEELTKELNEKNEEIIKLKEELNKKEESNKDLLDYIRKEKTKKLEEKELEEEKRKKEEEKRKNEEEEKKKMQVKENENEGQKKEENEIKKQEINIPFIKEPEQIKLLTDIICDFIFKLVNSQYYLSVFDLINDCSINYDLLDFFSKLNPFDNNSIDDYLFKFFNNMESYFNMKGDNGNFNDFLSQNNFKFKDETINVELLKKIAKLNIGTEKNILEIFKEKRENLFKSLIVSFDLFKKNYLKNENKTTSKLQSDRPDFLKIEKNEQKELIINMNEINMFKFYPLLKYQIRNIIPKLENLTIITSSPHIFLIYNICLYCKNLKSLSIIYSLDEIIDNKSNSSILCETFPILLNTLKTLHSLTIKNVHFENTILSNFKNSLLDTKINYLCLDNTGISKENFEILYPYFKGNEQLRELDLSNHNSNLPYILNNSIFANNNNLISLNLSQNNLNDNDMKILSDIILNNQNLKKLNISKNKLSQLSCSTLGYALNKTTTLEIINISECAINGETLLFLFNSKGSNTFKKIFLDDNNIGDVGLMMLSNFIKNSTKLDTISLKKVNGNDMGFSTIVSIILLSKSPLKLINLEENVINEKIIDEIIKNNDKYIEKGIVFTINASCVKDNSIKYNCLLLI